MNEQVEAFLRFLAEERRLSANTLAAYCNDLRQFEDYLASERAQRIRPDGAGGGPGPRLPRAGREEVVDFFLQLREKGYSPATIARKMAAIKSMFQFLHRRGDIATNPASALGSPEVKKPLPRAISVSDVDALLHQANKRSSPEGLRDAAMLQVLCATGVRVTELVSLDLADVDLAGRRVLCTGRNKRKRELPIDDRVVASLDTYLRQGRPPLLRTDEATDAIFLNHRGRRLTRQGFWLIMKALARDSGIASEVTPHTLRHSFAAHRLKDGLELHRLRELLGHANISTTQIYTQVRLEPEASAARPNPVGAGS
jgi:integrase/recombinase XerD